MIFSWAKLGGSFLGLLSKIILAAIIVLLRVAGTKISKCLGEGKVLDS
jgi:hypothetical protein